MRSDKDLLKPALTALALSSALVASGCGFKATASGEVYGTLCSQSNGDLRSPESRARLLAQEARALYVRDGETAIIPVDLLGGCTSADSGAAQRYVESYYVRNSSPKARAGFAQVLNNSPFPIGQTNTSGAKR